jgi:hypothetical protein
LRFAQPRGLGQKVSDEFAVPLCRAHHRELHRAGRERDWWVRAGLEPVSLARPLWLETHPLPAPALVLDEANAAPAVTASPKQSHQTQTAKRTQLPRLPT